MPPLPGSDAVRIAILVAAGTAAAVMDLRTGRIPNPLTAATAVVGVALAVTSGGSAPVGAALLGGVVGLAVMLPGYVMGGTGAGDVKLMAAFGTLLGPRATVWAFLISAIAGGVLAVAHALRRRRLGITVTRAAQLAAAPMTAKAAIDADAPLTRFAYGPALAAGAIAAALWR